MTKLKSQISNPKKTKIDSSDKSSKEPTTMEELLAQLQRAPLGFKRGDMVTGKITSITNKHLTLDIGGKSEATVHEKEMPYITDLITNLKIGDTINAQVVNPENDRGFTVVSLRKTALSKKWEVLEDKMKNNTSQDVVIKEASRSGFLVDYAGLRGFIPFSQVEQDLVRQPEKAVGRRVSVKVIEVDRDTNRLVFSQVPGGMNEKQLSALKQIKMGEVYQVEVTGIAPFGVFVTVKIDNTTLAGLVHISEIAWEKVENPADYVKVGQTLKVQAVGADQKLGKLTFSLKKLLADPWQDVAKMFSQDQTAKGTVSRISPYGVFVTLLPGIEGLIHISKMAPGEEPKPGQDIECVIEEVNVAKHKISLSLITHEKPIGYR